VVEIRVVEGQLSQIDVEPSGRFRPSYFRERLAARQRGVLNVNRLQEQLELFQIDPRIERVEASLEPGEERGRARLRVRVLEAPFYALSAEFDNLRTPAIGALGGGGGVRVANAIGVGDETSLGFAASEGLGQFQAQFSLPVNVWDTRLGVRYQYSRGDVVDGDFAALGIESESQTFGLILRQPLYRSLQTTVGASLEADWRRSQSFLFDGAVGLPTAYSPEGKSQVSVLRLGVDAAYRSRSQSMAFRSLLSVGLDALGATRSPVGVPGGEFVSWLGQLQWAGRLPGSPAQLVARFDTQLASAPLLPLEQFAVGGFYTVRGYRENAVVRDNGLAGSLELRLPIFARRKPDIRIDLAPFFDVGRSWNDDERPGTANSEPVTLASLGLGLRLAYGSWGRAEIYWGRQLESLDILGSGDLQDDGVQFRVSVLWP
nr:BamA/TamA family outer membrane protein [Myxococcota bacterium]